MRPTALFAMALGLAVLTPTASANHPMTSPVEDRYQPKPYITLKHPAWSKDAVLYQINTRQFTPEGTFRAAERELPRLKTLGVDILWLMPVHPIGEKNRKGTLGSPYSVRDYYGVNPEFGTLDDLKHFVDAAHAQGMYVILDWVANHTAWDNPMVAEHPEWYARDWKGDFHPTPWWDWSDIINLDYRQPGLRKYMTEAMAYWVRDVGVDGYRCDVAGFVPVDFWDNLRGELDAIKPVFMLAEWESRDLHAKAFDATYAWSWNSTMHEIAMGKGDVNKFYVYYSWNEAFFPRGGMRMNFVSNRQEFVGRHRVRAVRRCAARRDGAVVRRRRHSDDLQRSGSRQSAAAAVLREGSDRLAQASQWRAVRGPDRAEEKTSALWNGEWGAMMVHVPNDKLAQVLSFVRQDANGKVFAVFNLSPTAQKVRFEQTLFHGVYTEHFSRKSATLDASTALELKPWEYRVFVR